MRVAVTEGPSYLVDALVRGLTSRGDDVVRLTRAPSAHGDRRWQPEAGTIAAPGLDDVDAAINLYGASAFRRWSQAAREEIRSTRITATLTVVSALDPDGRCQRLLNLSSTSFYGDRGFEEVTTDSGRGRGFLADATAEWEGAARHAPVPTALLRTPPVLARGAGYLAERAGWLAGRLGSGRQYVPWIHLADWVAAVLQLLDGRFEGPVNLVSPEPVTDAGFVAARARATGRRPRLGVPFALLNARFGEDAARGLWLTSTRAIPVVLMELGFRHRFGELDAALADVAGVASALR